MSVRTKRAVALLEAANPVDDASFEPPALLLDELVAAPSPEVRRRHRPRTTVGLAAAITATTAAVFLVPGGGDEDVLARAAAALRGNEIVFTEARKVEDGRVVSRELSWASGDGERRRVVVYKPGGELESEIVDTPERASIFTPGDRKVDLFEGRANIPAELAGDPMTLLARARESRDGLRLVGEDHVAGQRVHLIEARRRDGLGATRIAVSADTYLPVSATIGLSTYEYDRIEKLPHRAALLSPTLTAERVAVCVHRPPGSAPRSGPACTARRWP